MKFKGLEIKVLAKTDSFSVKITTLEPGASTGEVNTHEGEEFHLVLKGKVVMTIGKERITVEKGETVQHSSKIPHAWHNGNEHTEILSINSPPYIYASR